MYYDQLIMDGKVLVEDYITVAPKQVVGNLLTGVSVLPVVDGKVGLLHVYRHPIAAESWEVPRGFLDAEEAGVASAIRELEEETGLTCAPENMRSLGYVTPDAGVLAARMHIFLASPCVRVRAYAPNELGHRAFRLFSEHELDDMLRRSEIQDPSTVIGLYKYFRGLY